MQVLKYPLTGRVDEIAMPAGAKILHCGFQHGVLRVWALVDPEKPSELRLLTVVGTGHDFSAPRGHQAEHIGTVFQEDGALVWHVFEFIQTVQCLPLSTDCAVQGG